MKTTILLLILCVLAIVLGLVWSPFVESPVNDFLLTIGGAFFGAGVSGIIFLFLRHYYRSG